MGTPEERLYEVSIREGTLLVLNRATLVRHAVRTAAHELNNAMQMVGGSAEMLAEMPDLPPRAMARVETILRHISRCHALIEGVAELARGGATAVQPVNVAQAVERILQLRHYEHSRAGVQVKLQIEPDALHAVVPFVGQDLDQILLALELNAEQAIAGRPGATLSVTVERRGAEVLVSIGDNGAGVGEQASAFRPFAPGAAGAGLGLFSAQVLAARHGAALSVEPQPSGGTLAILRLSAGS